MLTLRTRNIVKTTIRLTLLIILPAILTLVLVQYFTPKKTIQPVIVASTNNAPPGQEKMVTSGLPVRLMIPEITVDSPIEHVGVTPEGAMDIKKNPDGVVWFELGPRPGDGGNAVLAGHYGWENGKGSIFNNLHTLLPGDRLYIEDDRKMIIPFVVRDSRRYEPGADASDVFNANDGKPHLNLITCDGVWNEAEQTYSKRLVIFADKAV